MYDEYLDKPYTFQGYILPENTKDALIRYVEHRISTGGFLYAVLSNNLMEAIGHADEDNMSNIPAIVAFLYNEVPCKCYGSEEKVNEWLKGGQK